MNSSENVVHQHIVIDDVVTELKPAEHIVDDDEDVSDEETPSDLAVGEVVNESSESTTEGTRDESEAELGTHELILANETAEQANETNDSEEKKELNRGELVQILEHFVELVKNGDETLSSQLSFAPPGIESLDPSYLINDRTAEVEQLKGLLAEAQATIIRLLTERVEDRAKIASLESEVRLIPDLQAQAEAALTIAGNTGEVVTELTKVRLEIERMKLAKIRTELEEEQNKPWYEKLFKWLFKNELSADP